MASCLVDSVSSAIGPVGPVIPLKLLLPLLLVVPAEPLQLRLPLRLQSEDRDGTSTQASTWAVLPTSKHTCSPIRPSVLVLVVVVVCRVKNSTRPYLRSTELR